MTEERFNISFAAECLEGHNPAEVRAGVAKLFKADAATLDRLFSGKPQRIKRDCDKATAVKYQKSMATVGARAIVTRATPEHASPGSAEKAEKAEGAVTAAPETSQPVPTPAAPTATGTPIELSAPGSDVLNPEERRQLEAVDVNTSHLSVAEEGETLLDETPEVSASISAPDYDVSEVGARLAPEPKGPLPAAPDTSGFDLSPAGADLGDSALSAATPLAVNTGHLGLAEAGSELLSEAERKREQATAPDTSHLQLEQLEQLEESDNSAN